jgi:hypothetical protein
MIKLEFEKFNFKKLLIGFLPMIAFFSLYASPIFAQGDLLIFPKRIVFEGTQERVQTLHLTNVGKDTATYKISYVQARMTDEGKIENITEPDPGQNFAAPFLRFFPKTVSIAPGKSQLVKIQLIKISQLKPREYRSHLYFRAVPKIKALKKRKETDSEVTDVSISITPVFGYGMANIIRIGEPDIKVHLSNLTFEKFNNIIPLLNLKFTRSGNMSTYGDISIEHISLNGKKTNVGTVKGFAIYASNHVRKTKIKLINTEDVNYEEGELHVIYTSFGNRKTIFADAKLNL